MDMAAGAAASTGLSSSHPAQLLSIPNNCAAGWQWNNGAPTNGAGTPSLPPPSTTAPPHHQFMSFDSAVPNAAAMAAYGDNFQPSSSIANQHQRTDSPAYFHQQQMQLQQQQQQNSLNSPSTNFSAPDFAPLAQPPHQYQQAQMNSMEAQQACMRTGVGTPQATPISATMPPPYNSSPIRTTFPNGAAPAAQRMPHPQAMIHPRPPGFPASQPRFGLFVFHSDSANRAVIDVRRAEANRCQRWNSMCAWHMANMPPVNPFAMCRQGPSTSTAAPIPPQPSGNCGETGHLSPMNPPPTSTKSSSGGRGGTKRKALAQSVNATEPRHKSVSTPSPHFHSPLPQPLSVPTNAIVGNSWATGGGGGSGGGCHPSSVSSANCNINTAIPQTDPRRTSSTAGEFMTPPLPTNNNGGEMCHASAATTLNGYSEQVLGTQQQNNNSIVKPPPAGSISNMRDESGDDPLKRLELMTSQSLCDMPLALGDGHQQQHAASSKPGLLADDSASHYAAALAEQRSKEQKLARLEQISQCLSSSDMSPPFGCGEPNGNNGSIPPPNFRASQLMQFPPGGLPPTTIGPFQHPAPFPPGMAMRMPMPPHPTMQPVPPYMHSSPMNAHTAGIRQPIPDHHVYGGEAPVAPQQHQMNGGSTVSTAPIYGPSPTEMNFPQPSFHPLHHHHHNDISSMMPKDGMMQRRGPPDGLYQAGSFPGVDDAGGGMVQSANCWPQTHQMPQPLTNLDARVPVKQMQYYPNSAMNNGGAE